MELKTAKYELIRCIRKRGMGYVNICKEKQTKKSVTIRIIPNDEIQHYLSINGVKYPREIVVMKKIVGVKGSINLVEYEQNESGLAIVTEFIEPCQDLSDYIKARGFLTETRARNIIGQIIKTLVEYRKRGVSYNNIRDHNILINPETRETKIINFKCATLIDNQEGKKCEDTGEGYPTQVIKREQGNQQAAQTWAVGVLAVNMLIGNTTFFTEDQICHQRLILPYGITKTGQNFIKVCLEKEPSKRIKLQALQEHSWMKTNLTTFPLRLVRYTPCLC